MKKRLKKIAALPGTAAAGVGGYGGATGGNEAGWTVPVWICAVVGAVCAIFIVIIINDAREAIRHSREGRSR
ncbi:hypothetical protein ACTWJ8_31835 [Streptomyces sp. SDT5-1]|uniref:hypothetical protein n=1 Tax=Streptomyces sp. SDT5-1 TaxID=3406418 RepID=UPI003FD6BEAB